MADEQPRGDASAELQARVGACTRCPALVASRSQVVVGAGDADADVLLVADAPGADEDALGLALVGQAGRLLDRLLAEAGFARADVFVTSVVKCRPSGGRDQSPTEVANCSAHLVTQVELVRPVVVIALGGSVTKLLRGDPAPIRERRGREEIRTLGTHAFWLLPVFHPSAALYGPELVEQLRADLARLPDLVARGRPQAEAPPPAQPEPAEAAVGPPQLELF
ncbi:MAG: uracil-DNA glycosylase [Solirubrobacteraceae bacterium]